MTQTMESTLGQTGKAAHSLPFASTSLGDFTVNNHIQLGNLNGEHRYSYLLGKRQAEPEGIGLMNTWKSRLDHWTLEGLDYYEAEIYGTEAEPSK